MNTSGLNLVQNVSHLGGFLSINHVTFWPIIHSNMAVQLSRPDNASKPHPLFKFKDSDRPDLSRLDFSFRDN